MSLAAPPPELPGSPAVYTLRAGDRLVRFYDPASGAWRARRAFGPLADMRFDHHRPPLGRAAERSVWYAATSLRGALAESFGRLGFIDRDAGRHVAVVRVGKPIPVLDLVGVGVRRVGLTQEIAATTDYAGCQSWARAFYDQYPTLLGIRWRGRQVGSICVVLTDRATTRPLTLESDHDLADPAVWPRIARAARLCRLAIT